MLRGTNWLCLNGNDMISHTYVHTDQLSLLTQECASYIVYIYIYSFFLNYKKGMRKNLEEMEEGQAM